MIKIQEHLDKLDSDKYLDSLALKQWDFLNPLKLDGTYSQYSLINKLEDFITETNTQEYFDTISLKDSNLLKRQKKILLYFKESNYQALKKIIIGRPDELQVQRLDILKIIKKEDLYTIVDGKSKQTTFGKRLIKKIFNYNNYRKTLFCRELLLEAGFDVVTCPYCNDNFISIIDISEEEDEEKILRAYLDLDHFYPKSKNPFFALSFYNLIPSCHTCNSTEKKDKDFCITTHINPYYDSFNSIYRFFITPYPLGLDEKPIIEIKKMETKIDSSEKDLKLEIRYNKIHKDSVLTLIKMYQNYRTTASYYETEYSIGWQEALLQNVPKKESEILKKKTGKMYLDIIKQIDEIGILNL